MSHYTLGISSSNHDACICLIKDDKIVLAYPTERTNRRKNSQKVTQFDINLVAEFTKNIDTVVAVNIQDHDINNPKSAGYIKRIPRLNSFTVSETVDSIRQMLSDAKIRCKEFIIDNGKHHLYHAAAAFYSSGFKEANCLVIDGIGSAWVWPDVVLAETTTIFQGLDEKIKPLFKNLFLKSCSLRMTGWEDRDIDIAKKFFPFAVTISPHVDIGKLYGTITRHIGFPSSNEAGKTMGLAGYGKPNNLPPLLIPGTLHVDMNVVRNDSQVNTLLYPELTNPSDEIKKDLAYNVQKTLEIIFTKRVEQALSLNDSKNLVLGGGCALNIIGNSVIKKTFPHLNVFVEPIGSDASQALGAALFHHKRKFPLMHVNNLNTLYFGPEYSIVETKDKLLNLVEQYNNESSLPVSSN